MFPSGAARLRAAPVVVREEPEGHQSGCAGPCIAATARSGVFLRMLNLLYQGMRNVVGVPQAVWPTTSQRCGAIPLYARMIALLNLRS